MNPPRRGPATERGGDASGVGAAAELRAPALLDLAGDGAGSEGLVWGQVLHDRVAGDQGVISQESFRESSGDGGLDQNRSLRSEGLIRRKTDSTSGVSEYHVAMQIATGTVINGKIVVEGVSLTEGAVVTVVARGADESFVLTEAQENELLAAMAEIERGEYVTLEELLQSLPKHG
jgi:hypothetical protein